MSNKKREYERVNFIIERNELEANDPFIPCLPSLSNSIPSVLFFFSISAVVLCWFWLGFALRHSYVVITVGSYYYPTLVLSLRA
ncbi:hypothetical protein GGS21DRAFT_511437 [Xylaria nigripes]|nr:hypothetical protein GGS21DRAFT_511437 [Xylaria nigripes]